MISHSFLLKNFEGPLELLLCLIQKEELDICAISIKELTLQMMERMKAIAEVDDSSEMLSLTATLLLLKSQRLLPQEGHQEVDETDLRIELIQSLIEYHRIKERALILSQREQEQKVFFPRATLPPKKEREDGLQEIDLEHLKSCLTALLKKNEKRPEKVIEIDPWDVAERILWLRNTLKNASRILFTEIFSEKNCREELIVTFLALLELMKHQELKVLKENEMLYIVDGV